MECTKKYINAQKWGKTNARKTWFSIDNWHFDFDKNLDSYLFSQKLSKNVWLPYLHNLYH